MAKVIILGSGAAPGVPSLSWGFGDCNQNNAKNIRMRSGTYVDMMGTKLLIDTSPDLRMQLILSGVRKVDAVLYTHAHADHLHGIDDLREINRFTREPLDIYASKTTMDFIKVRFPYLINSEGDKFNPASRPCLTPHIVEYNKSFMINKLKITPIELLGHNLESSGYIFNDGDMVYIADFKSLREDVFQYIKKEPELLIMPLTLPEGSAYHASLEEVLGYVQKINAKRTILNHMAMECDYEQLSCLLKGMAEPSYDGMEIEFREDFGYVWN